MVVKFKVKLGEIVYLKTDDAQLPRIVTRISIMGGSMSNSIIAYEVSQGDESSEHYESEIITDKDLKFKLGI